MTNPRYKGPHQAIRKALVATIEGRRCARCGRPLRRGDLVDLDHAPGGGYLGLSHRACNRRHGQQVTTELRRQRRRRLVMPDRGAAICVGVELNDDRDRASVGAAWWDGQKVPWVALVAYLDDVDQVQDVVARLKAEHKITGILCGDLAGNFAHHLTDMSSNVSRASRADESDAYGELRDRVKSRRIRVRPHPALRKAIKHGQERRIGQAGGWLRHGAEVDMAPAHAVGLALWSLIKTPTYPPPDIF